MKPRTLLIMLCIGFALIGRTATADDDDHRHRNRDNHSKAYRKLNNRHREIVKQYREELDDADDRDDYREAREEYLEDLRDLEKDRRKQFRKYESPYNYDHAPYRSYYRHRGPVYHEDYRRAYEPIYGPLYEEAYPEYRSHGSFRYQGKHFSIYVD